MKCATCNQECSELVVQDGICKECTDEHYDLMDESMNESRQMMNYVAERWQNCERFSQDDHSN